VAIVWPCDDDFGIVLDYWDDQHSATASGLALARVLGKFMAWRDRLGTEETCLKHVNLVAHSMGNRVLATALASWSHAYGTVPALFRNLFMVAADVANDLFAPGRPGVALSSAARNVVVYHAADDFALRSSKVAGATTGSATPICWPTPTAGRAPCCATWSRPCRAAGWPVSRPTAAG
jgi:esterase/lipase superfamily enzyme